MHNQIFFRRIKERRRKIEGRKGEGRGKDKGR